MKLGRLPRAFTATLAACGLFAPIASANILNWNVGNGSFSAASSWTRNASDLNPPDADGIPDSNDNVLFDRGGGVTYTVTFPGLPLALPPAAYFTASTAVGSNNVTLTGSNSPLVGPSTYTSSVITISGSQSSPAILSTSLSQLATAVGNIGAFTGTNAILNVNGGTFAVTGSAADFDLFVGNAGNGILNVNAGAHVTLDGANGNAVIGKAVGVTGTANVSGSGATWANASNSFDAELAVGGFGNGMLNITAGGQVSDFQSFIAAEAGSTGNVTVNGPGSIWTNRQELVVGNLGTGTLTISDGGQVFDNLSAIGANPSADGTVNVMGAGSKWTQTTDLRLGSSTSFNGDTGPGTMHVTAGGQVATGGDADVGIVGSGTVTVDGNGSKWSVAGQIDIDQDSLVTVSGGGQITSESAFADGATFVSGLDSTFNTTDFISIGNFQNLGGTLFSTFNVVGGAHVNNRVAIIGDQRGFGQVVISDAGTTWNTSDQLFVGLEGKGEFFIGGGAQVTSAATVIAASPFSIGSIGVSGGSKWSNSGDLVVGAAGTGTLTVSNNGIVKVDGLLSVGLHGKLEGNSQVVANVRNGGTVAPGLTSSFFPSDAFGTLNLDGDFTQLDAGTLQIQLASLTSFDKLAINGHATLGGTLKGSLASGFSPAVGTAFQVLTATGGIDGTFDLEFTALSTGTGGPRWILLYSNSDVILKLVNLPAGDYNHNGVVDAADYTLWRDTLGQTGAFALVADGDNDHTVDIDDFNIWKANFGISVGSGGAVDSRAAAAVPEPQTIALAIFALAMLPSRLLGKLSFPPARSPQPENRQ